MDKKTILGMTAEYYREHHTKKSFKHGDRIAYAGRVFDEREMCNLVDSALDFWLTSGSYTERFEKGLAEFLGLPYCSLVNSGSSANLLAVMALTSPLLGERRLQRGDEVITVAAAFPTTVAPVVQAGAVPVFVDIGIPSINIDVSQLDNALSKRTKAVFLAHSLGNTFDLKTVSDFCREHGLWLLEDNCDALGGEYLLDGKTYKTGTIGDIGTSSFYPAHQMTMGEGGAVYTRNPLLHRIIRSMRDWGRDCVCPSGIDNTCGHRFSGQYGTLPFGYDHKYVYSHLGFNLKATDMQAAIGCAQLEKLPEFVKQRRANWEYLHQEFEMLSDVLILPEKEKHAEPSWFGFLLTLRKGARKTSADIVSHLEKKNIQTRRLFAGNILCHPCFQTLERNRDYRVIGDLVNTDYVMEHSFWVGVYPGMTREMMDYMAEGIKEVLAV